jgi:hypothetical protein
MFILTVKYFDKGPNQDTQLPIALQIAKNTTELDNIRMVLISQMIKPKHYIFFLRIGNYEERIVNKCSDILSKDIKKALSINKKVKIYHFTMYYPTNFLFIMCVRMIYEIK